MGDRSYHRRSRKRTRRSCRRCFTTTDPCGTAKGSGTIFNTLRSRGAKKAEIRGHHRSVLASQLTVRDERRCHHVARRDARARCGRRGRTAVARRLASGPGSVQLRRRLQRGQWGQRDLRDDLEKIEQWHERVEGEVPRYVSFLAKHNPLALKAFRARFETSTQRRTLPKQAIASCFVQYASVTGQPDALRRALHMARLFGVKRAMWSHSSR